MTLIDDIVSVEGFVKAKFPTATTVKQTLPKQPAAGTFVIRFQNDSRESETAFHFRTDRDYQIVYFGARADEVLAKMDALSTTLYQTQVIPRTDGSLRYVRVESFAFSQPFKTENELFACIGVLSAQTRTARDQQTYEKMMNVYARLITAP
ncbi:hypothetical protein [Paenibacillus elgii]|uniref:hypothetical protein n=1 Tax=Paenibacillus elgii TaxID=189691 RepID=UPI000248C313|nr:hypothetical protein [Paenibacillus elgii]